MPHITMASRRFTASAKSGCRGRGSLAGCFPRRPVADPPLEELSAVRARHCRHEVGRVRHCAARFREREEVVLWNRPAITPHNGSGDYNRVDSSPRVSIFHHRSHVPGRLGGSRVPAKSVCLFRTGFS